MNQSLLKLAVAAASAFAMAAPSAHAAPLTAGATISDISFTLIDLAPNDNITPSISFTDQTILGFASGANWTEGESEVTYEAGTVGVQTSFGSVRVAVASDALSNKGTLTPDPAVDDFRFRGVNHLKQGFTLTPNTGLSWTARGSLNAAPQGAYARAWLTVDGELLDKVDDGFDETQRFHLSYNTNEGDASFNLTGYLNTGALAQDGSIAVGTETIIDYEVSPVPEPASWGMLAAGLALVGARLRRKAG